MLYLARVTFYLSWAVAYIGETVEKRKLKSWCVRSKSRTLYAWHIFALDISFAKDPIILNRVNVGFGKKKGRRPFFFVTELS